MIPFNLGLWEKGLTGTFAQASESGGLRILADDVMVNL